jgi:D-sedoheptulose 7-phosphate isomerase
MTFEEQIKQTVETLESLREIRPQIERAQALILETLRAGGKLLICGNGGSAAEASHFATELVGRFALTRRSLPAIAISSDGSLLSCIANDFGYEQVFSRQISGLAQTGDLVVAFTSSGNSPNVSAALREAAKMNLSSISFLGRGGGSAKGLATVDLIIPGLSGRSAQEAHLFLIHAFCEAIDEAFPSP